MDSDKAKQTGNFVLILIAMVLGVLIGLMFASHSKSPSDGTLEGKVSEVMRLVEDEYVDAVDADSVSERIVAAILSELDPHSTYLSAR
jgi:carboxyl-terminal processing protease